MSVAHASADSPSSAVLPARSRIKAATGRRNLSDSPKSKRRLRKSQSVYWATTGRSKPSRWRSAARKLASVPKAPSGGARRASSSDADDTANTSRTAKPRRRSRYRRKPRFTVCISAETAGCLKPGGQRGDGAAANESAIHNSCGSCGAGCGLTTREVIARVTFGATT